MFIITGLLCLTAGAFSVVQRCSLGRGRDADSAPEPGTCAARVSSATATFIAESFSLVFNIAGLVLGLSAVAAHDTFSSFIFFFKLSVPSFSRAPGFGYVVRSAG